MQRLPIPHALPLLGLVTLTAGFVAGCGGGSTGTGAATPSGAPATTTASTPASTTTPAPARTTTTPPTAAGKATAALGAQTYTPPKRRFAAAPIGAADASRLARRGTIVLTVAVGGPGTVSAFGQAEIPKKGIVHVAESDTRVLRRAGVVRLALRLTSIARQQLAAGRGILMYVAVRFSKGQVIQRLTVPLKP